VQGQSYKVGLSGSHLRYSASLLGLPRAVKKLRKFFSEHLLESAKYAEPFEFTSGLLGKNSPGMGRVGRGLLIYIKYYELYERFKYHKLYKHVTDMCSTSMCL
jgi:hypothetical protein